MYDNKKKIIGASLLAALIIFVILLINNDITDNNKIVNQKVQLENIKITSAEYAEDIYYFKDKMKAAVTIHNFGENKAELWLGYSLMDPLGEWIDIHPKEVILQGGENKTIVMEYTPENLTTGNYTAVFAQWDSFPINENSTRISDIVIQEALRIYSKKDDFQNLDDSLWMKREFVLGRSKLQSENVYINNDKLLIRLPGLTVNGGEIQSRGEMGFGSYEIRMKLPNAPSSITGFFLYKEPDFFHEIDIEIYNEQKAYILFTTYADGDVRNEYKEYLDFDPSEDFHNYRFDYYPNKVSFYVNNEHQISWTEGFSVEPMRLILNTWYPKWLDGIEPMEDKYLVVDWIRY